MSDICAKNLGHGHAFNRRFGSTYKCQWCGALQSDIEEKAEYKSLLRENKDLKEQNALLTVQVQEGWKLVPVEPTADMIIAAGDGYETGEVIGPASCYRVMIAAAPALTKQVKSEDARDAARYRFMCGQGRYVPDPFGNGWAFGMGQDCSKQALDAAIDSAMSAHD